MSSSDSEDGKKHKGFKIGSSGTPVNWNGDDWTFYKHAMLNAFEKSLLDEIATGAATEDATWDQDKKDAFKKKQAKIKILIQGSLSMKLAKQVMSKKTGTGMWQELCTIYEGKKNPAMTAQKVYRLQGELHRTRLRANGDVRNHLYKLFELKDQLEDLKSPVNDLQMVDLMLRSLPTQTCYNELRRKVFFSSNMSKYTPEMVREMILTAESRSKDWENSAFGNSQGKKKPGSAAGAQKGGKMQTLSDESKKKTASTDFSCHHCGGKGHYKRNCPDLLGEEKPSGRRNAQAKYARSGAKPADTETAEPTAVADDRTLKRKVVVGEAVKWAAKSYDPSQWYFDTGTNAHIVASKEYFTVLQSMEDSDWNPTISGFTDGVGAQAEGFGTILLASMIDEEMVFVFLEDVLYVPGAGCNLFSPGLAMNQGFTMSWDQDSRTFGMAKDGIEVIRTTHEHRLWTFNAHNIGIRVTSKKKVAVKQQVVANFAVTDGVEDIDVWHERLAHTCPEYIRLMVDRGMAKGIMLKKRGKVDCADCHFGKQRRKTYRKKLDRDVERVNDLVFADLLIPGLQNGTQYSAVLVIMDAYSRFVTTYLLKSRTEEEVNPRMQEYIAWAERQHGVRVGKVVTRKLIVDVEKGESVDGDALVRRVLTDKGQEFCNGAMERWYKKKGIVHTKVGPNASQLNPVERTHQTLIGMVKTMMHQSGLPPSFWTHALETAVYVKNRVFCKGAGCTPYELMFGSKPDIHHIRAFGSVTYCHTPVSKRKKLSVNCRIGFLIGYREDVVGCHVYFPTEHKRGFVSDVKINEQIKYRDRYQKGFKMNVDKWLQTFDEFVVHGELDNLVDEDDEEDDTSSQQTECDNDSVRSGQQAECESEISDLSNVVMEDAEDISSSDQRLWDAMVHNSTPFDLDAASAASDEPLPDYSSDIAFGETQEGGSIAESEYADADTGAEIDADADDRSAEASEDADAEDRSAEASEIETAAENPNAYDLAVASGPCDSDEEVDVDDDCGDAGDAESEVADDPGDDVDGDDRVFTGHITDLVVVDTEDHGSYERSDYDCLFDPGDESEVGHGELALAEDHVIGRRRVREEDVKRARDPKRAKVDTKRAKRDAPPPRRPGLREAHERRKPERFEDFQIYSAFKALHADRRGVKGIRRSDVKIPRSQREATRSKYAPFWEAAMDKQVAALRAKGVLKMIPRDQVPKGQKLLKTMWVYDLKVDHLGFVIEFRARIVGRGDKQRPGIDYLETFSPVARMATFRLFVAVSKQLELTIYQGDVNTAYLNALLGIKQYLEDLDGYPCDEDDMVYMIDKALYGLKQSGREWNKEVNAWFLRYGFKQCSTEPCLYFYDCDGVFAIVLLYVDDILCATKDEEFKKKMFEQLDQDYGIKDQGLLSTYLGVEVEQNEKSIKIHQTQYCEQILEKFGFSEAHPSRIPMETTLRLTVEDTDTAPRKQEPKNGKKFPYRELVGSLMYLATCTRPDLAYAVGQLSRYVQCPTQQHIGAAKRVLRYLVGTKSQGIVYTRNKSMEEMNNTLLIEGYCDSDWGNNPDTRKSITGYVHCVAGGAVSWASRRQTIVAQSTAEAEYVAACEACMEAQGLRNVLIEVFPKMTTKLHQGIDNQAAFVMATNPTYSRRTRHIELRWHYVRDQVVKKTVELWKVKTDDNPSDLMTKPLASDRFEMLNSMIGVTKDRIPKDVTSEGAC